MYKSNVFYNIHSGVHFERLISTINEENEETTLSFRNINYQLNVHLNSSLFKSKEKRTILSNVSGVFHQGMNAILGPTGCGKSTLLDILADRKNRHSYQGEIFINHSPRPCSSVYRHMIGYVIQDDIYSGTLTVRENIMFSANLRLPVTISYEKRLEKVAFVLEKLSLMKCADTRMGTEFERGVSGGERKRTCIAMEMVLSPKILFLDEPTTGLDASTAYNVMQCLRELAQNGCTIVFSIHQPRHSIFQLFDTVLLMLNGHTVYLGQSISMTSYFIGLGYNYQTQDNPADFALDILNQKLNIPTFEYNFFENNNYLSNETVFIENASRSFLVDFLYVSQRTLRNSLRNSALLAWQTVVAVILGILTGLLYYQIPRTTDLGIDNRLGAIFFIIVNQIFSTTTALEPFIKERNLFIHENISGYYTMTTLFLAKLACDLLPLRIIPSVIFSIICYTMTGFQPIFSKFFIFLLTIFMANVFGSAMCFFIAASLPVFAVALIVLVLIFVIMMVFSGFLVDLSSVFSFLRWIKWVSAFRYASNVLYINEFQNLEFCLNNQTNICPILGKSILEQRSINENLWQDFFALTLMSIVSFLCAYLRLLFLTRK